MEMKGNAAIVTGGASGLGGATATCLARAGAKVTIFDLNRDIRTVGLTYKRLIDMHKDQPGYRTCLALERIMAQ